MVKMMMGGVGKDTRTVHAEPLSVTADYPKGCNGGPGPGKHSDFVHAGREGVLHLQLNTLAVGAKGTPIKTVSVNISGKLNLETEGQGVYAWWNMGGRDIYYEEKFGGIPNIEIPSRIYVCAPAGGALSAQYNVRGWASRQHLSLHSDASARFGTVKITKSKQEWVVSWRYQVYQMVEGDGDGTDAFKSLEVIATGSLS
ncbi:hypothetical protein FOZ63_001110, partial [Perkinsus olseni]